MDDPKEYAEDRCSLRDTRLSLDLEETLCHVVTTEVPFFLYGSRIKHNFIIVDYVGRGRQ